ncbi:MAG: hypothetical protein MI749_16800, partial [Desulfovibrionales bacterium]|nr:hypothetical protein [Desulfovibrionales bacterium]
MDKDTILNFSKLKTYSIKDRKSLVSKDDFAQPWTRGKNFTDFLSTLPSILAGRDIREVIQAIATAAKSQKKVCFGMGGHVIKTGMNPLLIDLMEKKVITSIAMNGSCIIHDLETAYTGRTSEDVAQSIGDGSFGMARETSDFLNQAIANAKDHDMGLGRAVGELILARDLPFKHLSLTAQGAQMKVPVTVHVALGTDIIHMHPEFDGGACGAASQKDFHIFAKEVAQLEKGVFINAGSAVILPEVFLKALT